MFDIGFGEMVVLAAIALIAIGPKQLPEVARAIGKMLNELKRTTGDLTKSFTDVKNYANDAQQEIMSAHQKLFADEPKTSHQPEAEVQPEPKKEEQLSFSMSETDKSKATDG
ncbi:MAG TPA: twin-arginine translocase TatA/TatE family subunit [Bdellovibrionales bacterium]|nr:twin-arginine translocase TatA/TatE family subunit [Bdellovibrionales bacterium]